MSRVGSNGNGTTSAATKAAIVADVAKAADVENTAFMANELDPEGVSRGINSFFDVGSF